jgi:shikimate kinase
MNVFLIGYRGSGKTTVAALVAGKLDWPWIDADAETERRAGKSIKQIFADEGEAAFRELEAAVVKELASRDRHVIALGGGAVLREENRQAIASRGTTVWLTASPETLFRRINTDPATTERRPNLTSPGGLEEVRHLLAQRTSLYAACADLTVDADRQTPEQVACEILASLHRQEIA